ncbi:MAG: PAS domain S-box protein [Blastocatellia bacterium]|nr:PAS domain S-box protein [Blastocatellia bacterium]
MQIDSSFFQSMVDNLFIFLLVNSSGKVIYVNPKFQTLFGYCLQDFTEDSSLLFKLFHNQCRDRFKTIMDSFENGGDIQQNNIEFSCLRKDHSIIYIEAYFLTAYDKDNRRILQITARDVSNSKRVDTLNTEDSEQLKQLTDNIEQVFWLSSVSPRQILYISPAFEKIWGIERNSIYANAKNLLQTVVPSDRDKVKLAWEKQFRGEYVNIEYRITRPDGTQRWIKDSSFPIRDHLGQLYRLAGIALDITDLKRVEIALRKSEKKFRQIAEAVDQVFFISPADSFEVLYISPAFERIWGIPCQSVYENPNAWLESIHPEDIGRVRKIMADLTSQKPNANFQYRIVRLDGEIRSLEVKTYYVREGSGYLRIGVTTDITERQKIEEALTYHKELFETIYNESADAILLVTLDTGLIIDCNKQAVEMFDFTTKEEMVGIAVSELQKEPIKHIEKSVQELKYKTSKGREFWGNLLIKHITVGNKNMKCFCITDITVRKKAEEERFKLAKLESLGTLAGGIAHDFNNLLTVIFGCISLTKIYANSPEKIDEILETLQQASERAKGLSSQLLTFAKGGEPIRQISKLQDLIRNSVNFSLHGSQVAVTYNLPNDLWQAEIDSEQVGQALQNLALNSRDSMPMGGYLTVEATNFLVKQSALLPLKTGKYVRIILTDTGLGIASEHLPKIFDPYFTTKPTGTGLGLAIVFSVTKKHGGHITVESQLGKGTKFYIYLPAAEPQLEQAILDKDITKTPTRILLMDDEVLVRELVCQMLLELGYDVELATNGSEAIKLYTDAKISGKPFALVLLDLTIPGAMGGKEALEQLLKVDKNVKAIVCSGYSEDPVMSNYEQYGFKGVLSKPFDLEDLEKIIDSIIG